MTMAKSVQKSELFVVVFDVFWNVVSYCFITSSTFCKCFQLCHFLFIFTPNYLNLELVILHSFWCLITVHIFFSPSMTIRPIFIRNSMGRWHTWRATLATYTKYRARWRTTARMRQIVSNMWGALHLYNVHNQGRMEVAKCYATWDRCGNRTSHTTLYRTCDEVDHGEWHDVCNDTSMLGNAADDVRANWLGTCRTMRKQIVHTVTQSDKNNTKHVVIVDTLRIDLCLSHLQNFSLVDKIYIVFLKQLWWYALSCIRNKINYRSTFISYS